MEDAGNVQDVGETQVIVQTTPESAPKLRKQTPQRYVDAFWQKFTTKYPGKVHSILPADIYAKSKASKTIKGVVSGQRTVKSYDQAASECKHAVEKIAKECRRVNHRYRDPHFDIEWDLKQGARDCLDGLEYSEESKTLPKTVKRIPDIFDKPVFLQEGATASDVRQGSSGDCWFLSALCSLCNKKDLIEKICVARDENVGVYGFVFHRDGEWLQTIIDDKLYLIASDWWESSDDEKQIFEMVNRQDAEERYRRANQTGSKALYFAQCANENETWLPLLEKAFAKAHGDYNAIDGGFTGEAIEDLTGGVTTELFTTDIMDKEKFWTDEIMKVNEEFLFGCATGTFDKWQGSEIASRVGARNDIIRMHAYSIMEAREIKGQRLVKLRNPWGEGEWKGPWSDGSEQWTPEWMTLLNHRFGDDGMFWISYHDLLRRYQSFDRTRLFGPDWSITQQWTEIDVPWSADYNDTKFSVTLTKRSPVVIVLSQLDDRYFQGLAGEYSFQLHFRLEQDGEDDYIVRSHGNYSMNRSVSTDLELDPGTYSVLMKITATRYQGAPTPERMIRSNVKFRQSKLIQVGLSYDLAHAKGDIIETEEEKAARQKAEEKKKAIEKSKQREAKRKVNRKKWEYVKREKAREKRHNKLREAYERKKVEAQETAEQAEGDANDEGDAHAAIDGAHEQAEGDTNGSAIKDVNGADPAAGVKGEMEKQVIAGAIEGTNGEPAQDPDSFTTPPTDLGIENANPTNEAQSVDKPTAGQIKDIEVTEPAPPGEDSANPTQLTKLNLQSIPQVTINGAPVANTSVPAASVAPPSTLAPNDDYHYDSDASYTSSIDSVLDFYPSAAEYAAAPSDDAQSPEDDLAAPEGDDADAEFEQDPWNAVCVVGLRVYSMDEGCKVSIVRPRAEEEALDLDDASKGVSGEVEGKLKGKGK